MWLGRHGASARESGKRTACPSPCLHGGDGTEAARPRGLALAWRLLPWEVYSALRMVGVRDGPPIITSAFRLVDHGRAVLEFGAHLKGSGWHQLGRARTCWIFLHSQTNFICQREQGAGGRRETSIGVPIENTGRPPTAASMGRIQNPPEASL